MKKGIGLTFHLTWVFFMLALYTIWVGDESPSENKV